jgi:hypothetical protein
MSFPFGRKRPILQYVAKFFITKLIKMGKSSEIERNGSQAFQNNELSLE